MWTQLPTIAEVADTHAKYLNDALAKPYILGYHRCQYIDRFTPHQEVLKQGLIQADGTPYEELVKLLTDTNHAVLKRFAAALLSRRKFLTCLAKRVLYTSSDRTVFGR